MYTKGPWDVGCPTIMDEATGNFMATIRTPQGTPIAVMRDWGKPDTERANARLIAAAPELYQVLDHLVKNLLAGHGTAGPTERAKVILRKAKGEL